MLQAAIAQAEHLKRIADLLEKLPVSVVEDTNEALEDFHYRRAQAEAWAKAERGE